MKGQVKRKSISEQAKDMIGKTCANCGAKEGLEYHHIVPLSLGGRDIPSNMVCLCYKCHSAIHHGTDEAIDHGKLVKNGIKKAKAKGTYKGGKPSPFDTESVLRMIAEWGSMFNPNSLMSARDMAEMLNMKPTSYHKYKHILLEELEKPEWNHSWEKPTVCREHDLSPRTIKRMKNVRDVAGMTDNGYETPDLF